MAHGDVPVVERKSSSALSGKLIDVMRERIIPMGMCIESLPSETRFVFTQDDVIDAFIKDLQRDTPEILVDSNLFMAKMQSAYKRYSGFR